MLKSPLSRLKAASLWWFRPCPGTEGSVRGQRASERMSLAFESSGNAASHLTVLPQRSLLPVFVPLACVQDIRQPHEQMYD